METNRRGGMCAAVCHGVTAFVTADILRGKNCTGNVPRSIEFSNAGGIFHDVAPQVDGNLITAIGPDDNGPFVDAMISWFEGGEQSAKAHMNDQYLKGKRVAIVLDDRYEYSQLNYPYTRLRHNGASVYFVANTLGAFSEYRNVGGSTKADMTAKNATNEKFDAIILVSHYAADTFRRHADVRQFIATHLQRGTLIASIDWGHTVFI
ncbi:MAG TPA: DJ-1/PfpI family protein, partial [Anaerolineae bacterium]|nr:DJ-1/PfpI family protein [Anaerolineae bacterium]